MAAASVGSRSVGGQLQADRRRATVMSMQKIERAADWIRGNAGVLSLIVAVLMFIGGAFSGISATARYFSTLATTEHVTTTVNRAMAPLDDDVDSLERTVNSLSETVGDLRVTVARLEETVGGFETSVSELQGTVRDLDDSVDTLNDTFPLLVSCVIELHGPWADGGEVQGRGDRPELPGVCRQARQAVSGR